MMLAILLWSAVTQQTQAQPQDPPPLPPIHGGPAPMTCPVGGERFSAWRSGSYSTYGSRPDGKPFSYMTFPFPLPECPSNKLIVFDDFKPDEVKALATLIETPEYKRMVKAETPYYRAYWLSTRLNRPAAGTLWLLLRAIWEVSPGSRDASDTPADRARMDRYQQAFVAGVRRLPGSADAQDRLWLTIRAANALRQMGRFAEAQRLLADARPLAAQDKKAAAVAAYIDSMARTIARKDADVEPIDLIPQREAKRRCEAGDATTLSPVQQALCRDVKNEP